MTSRRSIRKSFSAPPTNALELGFTAANTSDTITTNLVAFEFQKQWERYYTNYCVLHNQLAHVGLPRNIIFRIARDAAIFDNSFHMRKGIDILNDQLDAQDTHVTLLQLCNFIQRLAHNAANKPGYEEVEVFPEMSKAWLQTLQQMRPALDDDLMGLLEHDSIDLMHSFRIPLQKIFMCFAQLGAAGSTTWSEIVARRTCMPVEGYIEFAREFEIYPRLLSRDKLTRAFILAKYGHSDTITSYPLNYSEFIECLGRTALIAFSAQVGSICARLEALLDVLQVPFRVRFYDNMMDLVKPAPDSAPSTLLEMVEHAPPLRDGILTAGIWLTQNHYAFLKIIFEFYCAAVDSASQRDTDLSLSEWSVFVEDFNLHRLPGAYDIFHKYATVTTPNGPVMLQDEFTQGVLELAVLRYNDLPPRYAASELMIQLRSLRASVLEKHRKQKLDTAPQAKRVEAKRQEKVQYEVAIRVARRTVRSLDVYLGAVLVATMVDRPGFTLTPTQKTKLDSNRHCFLHFEQFDPSTTTTLMSHATVSQSFDQLIIRLLHSGYDVAASWPKRETRVPIGRCWWIYKEHEHVATLWDYEGQISCVQWQPALGELESDKMTMVVYKDASSDEFTQMASFYKHASDWRDMRDKLSSAGYELSTRLYNP